MVAVERRGGLVGDHDRGIADERPRYRDPLAAAGRRLTYRADRDGFQST